MAAIMTRVRTPALVTSGLFLLLMISLSFYTQYQARQEIVASNQMLATLERKVADVDPAVYAAYVGTYQLDPDFYISITTNDAQLYAQGTNQIRVELFPLNEQSYFNNYTEAVITFDSPSGGSSGQFILRQIDAIRLGQRI